MMSTEGLAKLEDFGIAPPGPTATPEAPVLCPQCASAETRTVSRFGSTACKALMVCSVCREPFDYFKAI
jgi:ring-1,2-phenylacetyl-CoA epoxidase subunit PaaD